MSTSHRAPRKSRHLTASTLLAAGAATIGIGFAAAAPANADTNLSWNHTYNTSTTQKNTDLTKVVAIVKRLVSTLHAKPCATPAPAPQTAK